MIVFEFLVVLIVFVVFVHVLVAVVLVVDLLIVLVGLLKTTILISTTNSSSLKAARYESFSQITATSRLYVLVYDMVDT